LPLIVVAAVAAVAAGVAVVGFVVAAVAVEAVVDDALTGNAVEPHSNQKFFSAIFPVHVSSFPILHRHIPQQLILGVGEVDGVDGIGGVGVERVEGFGGVAGVEGVGGVEGIGDVGGVGEVDGIGVVGVEWQVPQVQQEQQGWREQVLACQRVRPRQCNRSRHWHQRQQVVKLCVLHSAR